MDFDQVDYDNSVPLLLDELMDSNIIKCDVGFGMTADPVFATKPSPSHESDSGCSDMGDLRSVSPDRDVDLLSPGIEDTQVNLFDFESVASVESVEKLDEELETYLAEPFIKNKDSNLSVDFDETQRPGIKFPQSDDEIDIESTIDEEELDMPKRRIIQSKAVIPSSNNLSETVAVKSRPEATVIRLPSSTNSKPTDICILPSSSASSNLRPAVKVVKVVKTSAESKKDIDNELLKALDDRNKKNAVQAKINREKKKAYVKSLEDEIETLKCENFALKENLRKHDSEKKELEDEIQYLRSVLANQSMLAGLLKNIGNVGNCKMSSSFASKRNSNQDHDYQGPPTKQAKRLSGKSSAGVCLHVDQGSVSLEFCSKCAVMAKSSEKE